MNYEAQLFQFLENLKNNLRVQPLFLGGTASYSGGVGGPPGGFIGFLPQTRVAYDFGESATNYTPESGMSLWDNLNHIRYRIQTLEAGGEFFSLIIKEDGTVVSSGISVINFVGADVVETLPGNITVTISGGVGSGDMSKAVYDTDNDGIVDAAETVPWVGISGIPATFPPESHNHDDRYYTETELQTSGQASVHYDNITNVPTISGTGVDNFLDLSDTPNAYTGQANKVVSVKTDETGLEFVTPSGGSGSPLTVQEIDGTPNVSNVTTIRVTNGTLTDDTGGVITLDFGSAATDGSAIHDNVASEIHAITAKPELHGDDEFILEDSADSYGKRRVRFNSMAFADEAYMNHPYSTDFDVFRSGNSSDGEINDLANGLGCRLTTLIPDNGENSWTYAVNPIASGTAGWQATARVRRLYPLVPFAQTGMILRDSVSGKSVVLTLINYDMNGFYRSDIPTDEDWDNPVFLEEWAEMDFWIRVKDDLTDWIWYTSSDGNFWYEIYRETRNTYLEADATHAGIAINANVDGASTNHRTIGSPIGMDCFSFTIEELN